MSSYFPSLRLLSGLLFVLLSLPSTAFAQTSVIALENTLVKTTESSAVYYVHNGKRYAFPNEKIYFSWYKDFSNIVTISSQELAALSLAGNVTYKPGSHLIKIQTDPKVYLVSRYGVLHWINESTAAAVYGADWGNHVHDLDDTFFTNYIVGPSVTSANQYDLQTEQALASVASNIRPVDFTIPPLLSSASAPTLTVGVSTPQATLNQIVTVFVLIADTEQPLSQIDIFETKQQKLVATCLNALNCKGAYTVTQAPLTAVFKAIAIDKQGKKTETAIGQQATLEITASSNDILIGTFPSSLSSGSKAEFFSDAGKMMAITSHQVYMIVPGEPNPILWKDCKTNALCQGSTPFYRTSQLFSKVVSNDKTFYSAAVTVVATGGVAPKPSLTITSRPAPNQATLSLTAPIGEGIGFSTIVIGTTPDDYAIALCDQAQCQITVQVNAPQTYTAFTDVGGKLEASNSITIAP